MRELTAKKGLINTFFQASITVSAILTIPCNNSLRYYAVDFTSLKAKLTFILVDLLNIGEILIKTCLTHIINRFSPGDKDIWRDLTHKIL